MGTARLVLLLGNLALAVLLVASYGWSVGWPRHHHDVAYVTLALWALAARPLLRRRHVTSLLLASLAAWSTITGIFLVYVTPDIGHARWMRWWHGVTSVGFFLAFLAHWARNQPRLMGLARRLARHRRMFGAFAGAWALALVAFLLLAALVEPRTWDRDLTAVSTVAFGAAAAGVAWAAVVATGRRMRERLARPAARNPLRGAVDASLLVSMWVASLTGFALLYAGRPLRAAQAYWLTAAWHVIVSALLLALVAAHVTFNARPLLSHTRQ